MNREELKERAGLTEEEAAKLERIEETLGYMADLTGRDLFIDCLDRKDGRMFVAAQAGPMHMPSSYMTSVVGCYADREDEPAVYRAAETKSPVRDIKAVTQESANVRQDAVPVYNDAGDVIGVLIGERDVSREIMKERKYEELVRRVQERTPEQIAAELLARREAHHRIKNHLQLVASLMNMQIRRTDSSEVRDVLKENAARVQSIARVNEILVNTGEETVGLLHYLEGVRQNMALLYETDGGVSLVLSGDEVTVTGDQAADIALVVNELVSNAFKHAFPDPGAGGTVRIIVKKGAQFSSVTVQDTGSGFDVHGMKDGFGMSVVRMTVRDKLHGKLYAASGEGGTSFTFDFQ